MKNRSAAFRFLLACAVFGIALGCVRPAAAEQRVALIIGNSAYPAAPLKNPLNDARALAKLLNQLGFEVLLKTNLNQRGLVEAMREFSAKLKEGDVALFYYSGHGMQVKGRNFLIPVDADIRAEDEVPYLSFDVSQILDKLEAARTRVNLVILDACRNNPFIRTFRSGRTGLAQMDAPGGTLIAFSTAPGSEARDGDGDLGTYTRHLIAHLPTPGLPVEVMFRQVREGVTTETKDRQVPWESSSLKGQFYFSRAVEKPVLAAPAAAPAPGVDPASFEMAFWDSIKTSTHRADFEAYLEQYPKGRFAPLARNRVKSAEQQTQIAAAQTPAREPLSANLTPLHQPQSVADSPPPAAAPRAARAGEVIVLATPSSAPKAPASARALKIGDSWTYQLKDLRYNKTQPAITLEITGGDASGIQEILRIVSAAQPNDSRNPSSDSRVFEKQAPMRHQGINRLLSLEPRIFEHQLSSDVTLFEFAPFLTQYSELTTGAAWPNVPGAINTSGESTVDWRFSGKVVGRERVSVPAGNFDAIKVELTGALDLGPSSRTMSTGGDFVVSSQDYTAWFAPEVGRLVKYSRKTYNRRRSPLDDEVFELINYSLK